MTTTIRFEVKPGVAAPVGAPALNVSNIRPAAQPVGDVADFLDQFGGSYDPFQRARLAQSYFDLRDAGILAAMDLLCIRGLTSADSLINWSGTSRSATVTGATFDAGRGFVHDGIDDFIDLNWAAGRYALGDASIFAGFTEPDSTEDSNPRLFAPDGGAPSADRTNLNIGSSANAAGRINRSEAIVVEPNDTNRGPQIWSMTDVDGLTSLYEGAEVIGTTSDGTHELPGHPIHLSRNRATFYGFTLGSFGYGAALTANQIGVLNRVINAMHRVI